MAIDITKWSAVVVEVSPASGSTFEVVERLANDVTDNIPFRVTVPLDVVDHKAYIEDRTVSFINSSDNAAAAKVTIVPGLELELKQTPVVNPLDDPKLDEFMKNLALLRKVERNPNLDTGIDKAQVVSVLQAMLADDPRFLNQL